MAAFHNEIACDIDFERPGRQLSHLRLSHSDDEHAFGTIPIPIAVIGDGAGPTVLLTAGNHGDEYEGQVILGRLIRETDPASVKGRLIVLPALNYPAVVAGTRVSPLDGLNMNRSFPGEPADAPTRSIANFVDRVLLPRCDAGIDLHSGGTVGTFLPCTFVCTHPDRAFTARLLDLADAFAAPYVYAVDGEGSPNGLDPVAHRHGVALISTELAGGASLDRAALEIGRRGVERVLRHLGVLEDGEETTPAAKAPRYLRGRDHGDYVMAPLEGLFEPYCELGQTVGEGEPAGAVHPLDDPARTPVEVRFARGGLILSRRVPARVRRGDYLFTVAAEVARDELLG